MNLISDIKNVMAKDGIEIKYMGNLIFCVDCPHCGSSEPIRGEFENNDFKHISAVFTEKRECESCNRQFEIDIDLDIRPR